MSGRDPSSRHQDLPTYQVRLAADGPAVELFVPRTPEAQERALSHRVLAGDRLDLLANRYFGDPFQYWRILDANPVLSPEELLEPGRVLVIPGRR